jgi:large subunit ribosomal protein L23
MSLLNKLFKKTKKEVAKPREEKKVVEKTTAVVFKPGEILLSPHTAEKALAAQQLNQYVFKVAPFANKIMVAKEIKKNYNVKVVGVNIINIPRKARLVGKTKGFKTGYKKAIVTLAKGQTIEMAK